MKYLENKKNKGFTIIELLVVIGIIGILVGVGTINIRKQENSKSLLRVKNELGDFFRVGVKHAKEVGQRYIINFLLDKNEINIERDGNITRTLSLPQGFEYEKITGTYREQNFTSGITPTGNMSGGFTLYVFESNNQSGIQGDEKAIYAVSFSTTEKHVQYVKIKERIPKSEIFENEINPNIAGSKDASKTTYWKIIKKQ